MIFVWRDYLVHPITGAEQSEGNEQQSGGFPQFTFGEPEPLSGGGKQ